MIGEEKIKNITGPDPETNTAHVNEIRDDQPLNTTHIINKDLDINLMLKMTQL